MLQYIITKIILILIPIAIGTGLIVYLKRHYRKATVEVIESVKMGLTSPSYKDIVSDIETGEELNVYTTTKGKPGRTYNVYRPQDGKGPAFRTKVKALIIFTLVVLALHLCLTIVLI